jgi:hypothetical protein
MRSGPSSARALHWREEWYGSNSDVAVRSRATDMKAENGSEWGSRSHLHVLALMAATALGCGDR